MLARLDDVVHRGLLVLQVSETAPRVAVAAGLALAMSASDAEMAIRVQVVPVGMAVRGLLGLRAPLARPAVLW